MEEVTVQSKTLEKFELQNSDFGKVHGQYLSAVTDPAVLVLMNVTSGFLPTYDIVCRTYDIV